MNKFKIHTPETANAQVGQVLNSVENMVGFIPNVFAVIGESLPALQAFVSLNEQFSQTALNPTEREIVQTAVSVENQCTYCVAGHTAFAEMQDVRAEIIESVRNNEKINDAKLETLNQFTRQLVRSLGQGQGMIPSSVLDEFLEAGYTPAHVLEVVTGICVKIFSNLANNIIGIPLDDQFSPYAWQPVKPHQAA